MNPVAYPTIWLQCVLLAWTNRLTDDASDTVIRSMRLRAGRRALLQRRVELVAERRTLLNERHALLQRARSVPSGHPAIAPGELSPEPRPGVLPP